MTTPINPAIASTAKALHTIADYNRLAAFVAVAGSEPTLPEIAAETGIETPKCRQALSYLVYKGWVAKGITANARYGYSLSDGGRVLWDAVSRLLLESETLEEEGEPESEASQG